MANPMSGGAVYFGVHAPRPQRFVPCYADPFASLDPLDESDMSSSSSSSSDHGAPVRGHGAKFHAHHADAAFDPLRASGVGGKHKRRNSDCSTMSPLPPSSSSSARASFGNDPFDKVGRQRDGGTRRRHRDGGCASTSADSEHEPLVSISDDDDDGDNGGGSGAPFYVGHPSGHIPPLRPSGSGGAVHHPQHPADDPFEQLLKPSARPSGAHQRHHQHHHHHHGHQPQPRQAPFLDTHERNKRSGSDGARRTDGADDRHKLAEVRKAHAAAVDALKQREADYAKQREERIRQMDAEFSLSVSALREEIARTEDSIRAVSGAINRHYERLIIQLDADATMSDAQRMARRHALERERAMALNPDDAHARHKRPPAAFEGDGPVKVRVIRMDPFLSALMGGALPFPFGPVPQQPPMASASPMPQYRRSGATIEEVIDDNENATAAAGPNGGGAQQEGSASSTSSIMALD